MPFAVGLYVIHQRDAIYGFGVTRSLFFKFPTVEIVDFGKYRYIVQVDQRRAVASDSSGNLTANGPVPLMMKRFLQGSDGLKISGLRFNFTF